MDALFGTMNHVSLAQECARAVLIFVYGLVMLRLSGRRTFARWAALDIVISIVVGSNLSRALTGNAPLAGTLAAVAVLIVLHFVCGYLAAHRTFWSKLLEGHGLVLGEEGAMDTAKLRRHLISDEDLREAFRQKGVEKAEQTKQVTLEANGKISIQHKVDPIVALGAIAEGMEKEGRKPAPPYENFAQEKR